MSEQHINSDQIEQDIRLMVGGKFMVDHVGPDVVNEVSLRARTHADAYLDAFDRLFLGSNFNAITNSDLRLPAFLTFMAEVKPERVRVLADQLLNQYNATLVVYDSISDKSALENLLPLETLNLSIRLDRQRAVLRNLASR